VSGKELWRKLVHIEDQIEFVAFSADGRVLATAGRKGFDIWDAVSGQQLFQRAWPKGLAPKPFDTPIDSLAFLPGGRAVVTGMRDGTLLVWDLDPETWRVPDHVPHLQPGGILTWDVAKREIGRETASLGGEELDALWSVLAGDARSAQLGIRTMIRAPAQSVALLKDRLQPVAEVDPERVQRLIADLDSGRFEKRASASQELAKLGEQIEPDLRKVLESKPSLETRERVETLLTALRTAPSGSALRALRALQALEGIGTQEARQVLDAMAKGAPRARVTQEAEASLERLAKRNPSQP
jgi:hypothetical protein